MSWSLVKASLKGEQGRRASKGGGENKKTTPPHKRKEKNNGTLCQELRESFVSIKKSDTEREERVMLATSPLSLKQNL